MKLRDYFRWRLLICDAALDRFTALETRTRVGSRSIVALVVMVFGAAVSPAIEAQEPAGSVIAQNPIQAKPQAQPAPGADANVRYWTTSWSFEDIDAETLNARLMKLGLRIPIEMVGKVSVNFDVSLPLNALTDAKKYRVEGQVRSSRLKLEQLVVEDFRSTIVVRQGVMSVNDVQGRVIDARASNSGDSADVGRVSGNASLELSPIGNIKASLQLNSVAIGPLHELLIAVSQRSTDPLSGAVSGSIEFQAPLKSIKDVRQWNAKTDLQISQFSRGGQIPLNVDASSLAIANGEIRAENLQITSDKSPDLALTLRGRVELTARQRFTVGIRANDLPLEVFTELAGMNADQLVVGLLDLDATARGELADLTWDINGRIASPGLRLAGVDLGVIEHSLEFTQTRFRLTPATKDSTAPDELTIGAVNAQYSVSRDRFDLTQIVASLFGGEVSGTIQVGLGDGGDSRINLNWHEIAPTINAQLFSLADVTLSATTSGKIDRQTPSSDWSRIAAQSGTAEIQLDSIRVGEAEIGQLAMTLVNDVGEIQLKAAGEMFGGKVDIATQSTLSGDMGWRDLLRQPTQIDLSLNALEIGRLFAATPQQFVRQDRYRLLRGALSSKMELSGSLDTSFESSGTVRVERLMFGSQLLARYAEAKIRTRDNTVFLDLALAEFANGRIKARGEWGLRDESGRLDVTVDAVDASSSMLLISEKIANQVGGKVSGQFYVSGGELLQARGSVQLSETTLAGLPLGNAHSGFHGTYSLQSGQWRADFSSISGKVARGQFKGDANFKSSFRPNRFDLTSQWKFDRVDFGELIAQASGGTSSYARGQIRGKLTLGGSGIASSNDLRGRFDTELDGSQATAIPGLSEAQRYLGAVPLAGIRIDDGRAKGTIGGGRVNVDELVLGSETLKFWAEGSVVIASQRMEIDAVISTGSFEVNEVLQRYGQTLLLTYTTPLGIFLRVNELLSNRTIYVDIRGTVANPQLRLKPLATLRDEAVRYLLTEFLGINCYALSSANPLDLEN